MKIILQIEHLTKDFENDGSPAYKAVDDVSVTLNCGEKLAIIGESGSGKTTVVNMITRLVDTTKGKIILDGEDITNLTGKKLREAYRKMQMVFQTPVESFDPRCTLGDGIMESLINSGFSKKDALEEAKRLLKECGLPEKFINRYPQNYSISFNIFKFLRMF